MSRTVLSLLAGAALAGAVTLTPQAAQAAPREAAALTANPWAAVTATMLPDAIRAIERGSGGRVLEIRFRAGRRVAGFEAVVANPDGSISQMAIAFPELRAVMIGKAEIPDWMTPWPLRADVKSIQKAKIPLADAVVMAERMVGGIAIDAGLAKPLTADNAVLAYNIEIVRDGRPQRVVIDAQTGLRIEDPQMLEGWSPEETLMRSLQRKP